MVKRADMMEQGTGTGGEWLERPVHENVGTGAMLEGMYKSSALLL